MGEGARWGRKEGERWGWQMEKGGCHFDGMYPFRTTSVYDHLDFFFSPSGIFNLKVLTFVLIAL